ncbi:MAG TPA: LON peptidase substrate-binding domain-containing protein [Burkholderiales bacterium]|nr:LON peptidase substrate-binding domain-containing protein [Burkholderiales bacterium]
MRLQLPIFPLNTVLYPGGLLPLKIFEQRYLEMTKACLRDAAPFGVCRIREGLEVGSPAVPEPVGCTAIIAEWEMPHLGVFHLKGRGQQAFRILEKTTQRDGLIRAEVELLEDAPGNLPPDALQLCRQVLEQIVNRVGSDYFFAPLDFDNPRWVSYRLAEVLPLGMEDRQALLEARDDSDRLSRLRAFLRRVE